jgi:hypothetical protein
MDARAPYAWQAVVQRALAMGPQRQARHDADWVEAKHPRGQPENAGQFAPKPGGTSRSPQATTWDKANDPTMNTRFPGVAPSAEAPPMPKLPEFTKGPEAKEIHKELKRLAAQIDKVNAAYPPNTGDWREQARVETLERIPMSDLVRARRDLWERSSVNTNKLTKGDQALYDTINGEILRRLETDKKERDERAHRYAYMSVEEFNDHIGAIGFLGGDSRMMPGIKAQLGMLPPRHLRALRNQGMKIRAVQEIAPLSDDHPYAPGMQPAGLFHPGKGLVEVADQVSLPDGSKRQLYSRTQTLRHEVGHAIDNITEVSFDPDLAQAIYDGIKRMTPLERGMAAYYLGEGAKDDATRLNARRLETFAELYAYAYNQGASELDENGTFGGMSGSRRFELFGRAKDILRQKVAAYFNDRRLDSVREAA